jgi:hypothetical protein
MRPFIRNHYLPQWLHRLACGAITAALAGTIAIGGLRYFDADSWLHTASVVLLWSNIPIGLVFACVAHRFSVIEGCAGDIGYEGLDSDHE